MYATYKFPTFPDKSSTSSSSYSYSSASLLLPFFLFVIRFRIFFSICFLSQVVGNVIDPNKFIVIVNVLVATGESLPRFPGPYKGDDDEKFNNNRILILLGYVRKTSSTFFGITIFSNHSHAEVIRNIT